MTLIQPTAKSTEFVDSVLRLKPQFAAFDCDGTLWAGDAGEGFFDWELKRGLVSDDIVRWARARYADYRAGKVSEEDMCADMVTLHKGMKEADALFAAKQFFEEKMVHRIFPEMRTLVRCLLDVGCDVWAVSSTNEWVIRSAMRHFGIPAGKILAATVRIENGRVTGEITRLPSGEGKPRAIREVVKRDPDTAFGNSRWDADMLAIARHAFAVNPNPDLEEQARQKGWEVYWPDAVQR